MSAKDKDKDKDKDKGGTAAAMLVISYEPKHPQPWTVEDLTRIKPNTRRALTTDDVGDIVKAKCERWLLAGRVTA